MDKYGYRLSDDGEFWFKRGEPKAFSAALCRDCEADPSGHLGMRWLKSKLQESVPAGDFRFYVNRPADAQAVAAKCGMGHLKGVEICRIP